MTHRTDLLALIATLLAIWLALGTMDYQYAVERERDDLAAQVTKLKAQVADPSKFCREHFYRKMKGKR